MTGPTSANKNYLLLKEKPILNIISYNFLGGCLCFWQSECLYADNMLLKKLNFVSVNSKARRKSWPNCFVTGLFKWKLANEVRQLAPLRMQSMSNCDLKYAHNPLI